MGFWNNVGRAFGIEIPAAVVGAVIAGIPGAISGAAAAAVAGAIAEGARPGDKIEVDGEEITITEEAHKAVSGKYKYSKDGRTIIKEKFRCNEGARSQYGQGIDNGSISSIPDHYNDAGSDFWT